MCVGFCLRLSCVCACLLGWWRRCGCGRVGMYSLCVVGYIHSCFEILLYNVASFGFVCAAPHPALHTATRRCSPRRLSVVPVRRAQHKYPAPLVHQCPAWCALWRGRAFQAERQESRCCGCLERELAALSFSNCAARTTVLSYTYTLSSACSRSSPRGAVAPE